MSRQAKNAQNAENSQSRQSDQDKQELKNLFAAYQETEEALALAKQEVERAMCARSKVLQRIENHSGPGPYNFNGSIVKIVHRGDTLFFRGKGQSDVIAI